VEVCLLTGKPFSAQRMEWREPFVAAAVTGGSAGDAAKPNSLPPVTAAATTGVLMYRERAELYARINQRVEQMFAAGVVEEVRRLERVSATAEKTLGLAEIRSLLAGEISQAECIAKIQQATRRYAKRQLTWFQRQTNFSALNLSKLGSPEAIDFISQGASRVFAHG
jgi:tRNA A37 N6-isopentenylltransferase MiaA